MKKLIQPIRLAVVLLLLALVLSIYVVALYDLQVVNGDTWSTFAENNRPVRKTVEATRGRILDRNGAELVSNRSVNNIVLDWDALYYGIEEDTNDVLLSLVDLTEGKGYSYTDTLPISGSPFTYTEMSGAQEMYLNAYIAEYEKKIWELIRSQQEASAPDAEAAKPDTLTVETVTAVQLMAFMREQYAINAAYTSEETRVIAGIRYEIDLRYNKQVGMSEYIFAEDVGVDLISAVLEQDYPGILVRESSVRRYNTTLAPHLLGRVGLMTLEEVDEYPDYPADAYVGKEGIEKDYEDFLHGVNGRKTQTVTASGTVIRERTDVEAVPGGNVVTTIDSGLQAVGESALGATIRQLDVGRRAEDLCPGGGVVAMDMTGGVLAMVSTPGFSLESYTENFEELAADEAKPLLNRATAGAYPPGSTFKMVTALAGLHYGVISEWSTIYCDGKFHAFADSGYVPGCMGNVAHGNIALRDAIAYSCNVYFFTVANWLGTARMSEFSSLLGFGDRTGIGFGEDPGQISSPEVMEYYAELDGHPGTIYPGDVIQIGIGQGKDLCTPIQLANYVATIANGGVRYKPHLLSEVRSFDGNEILSTYTPEILVDLTEMEGMSASYFTAIQQGMAKGATDGTGRKYFADFMVPVATKTGTAETSLDGYADGVFVCYAPADNPQIAIAVVIEKGGAGSDVIPVAKAMLEYFFRDDEIAQDIVLDNALLG